MIRARLEHHRLVIQSLVSLSAIFLALPMTTLAKEASPLPGQRVILVTGSTGGLGKETALALARAGNHETVTPHLRRLSHLPRFHVIVCQKRNCELSAQQTFHSSPRESGLTPRGSGRGSGLKGDVEYANWGMGKW